MWDPEYVVDLTDRIEADLLKLAGYDIQYKKGRVYITKDTPVPKGKTIKVGKEGGRYYEKDPAMLLPPKAVKNKRTGIPTSLPLTGGGYVRVSPSIHTLEENDYYGIGDKPSKNIVCPDKDAHGFPKYTRNPIPTSPKSGVRDTHDPSICYTDHPSITKTINFAVNGLGNPSQESPKNALKNPSMFFIGDKQVRVGKIMPRGNDLNPDHLLTKDINADKFRLWKRDFEGNYRHVASYSEIGLHNQWKASSGELL